MKGLSHTRLTKVPASLPCCPAPAVRTGIPVLHQKDTNSTSRCHHTTLVNPLATSWWLAPAAPAPRGTSGTSNSATSSNTCHTGHTAPLPTAGGWPLQQNFLQQPALQQRVSYTTQHMHVHFPAYTPLLLLGHHSSFLPPPPPCIRHPGTPNESCWTQAAGKPSPCPTSHAAAWQAAPLHTSCTHPARLYTPHSRTHAAQTPTTSSSSSSRDGCCCSARHRLHRCPSLCPLQSGYSKTCAPHALEQLAAVVPQPRGRIRIRIHFEPCRFCCTHSNLPVPSLPLLLQLLLALP